MRRPKRQHHCDPLKSSPAVISPMYISNLRGKLNLPLAIPSLIPLCFFFFPAPVLL